MSLPTPATELAIRPGTKVFISSRPNRRQDQYQRWKIIYVLVYKCFDKTFDMVNYRALRSLVDPGSRFNETNLIL